MNDSIKPTSDFFGMSHTGDSYPPAPSLPSPVMVQKKIEARPLPLRSRAGAVESEGKHAWAQRGREAEPCVLRVSKKWTLSFSFSSWSGRGSKTREAEEARWTAEPGRLITALHGSTHPPHQSGYVTWQVWLVPFQYLLSSSLVTAPPF